MGQLHDIYTEWAESYDNFAKKNIGIIKNYPIIIDIIRKEKKNDQGLDLGCGTGLLALGLSRFCKKIVGIDFSASMLSEARKKQSLGAELVFQYGDITKRLPFDNESFDFAVASLVFNHIENIAPILREIWRVLRKGGVLVFDEADMTPRTPDQLKYKLRVAELDPLLKRRDQGANVWYGRPLEKVQLLLEEAGFGLEKVVKTIVDENLEPIVENYQHHKGRVFSLVIKARKS